MTATQDLTPMALLHELQRVTERWALARARYARLGLDAPDRAGQLAEYGILRDRVNDLEAEVLRRLAGQGP